MIGFGEESFIVKYSIDIFMFGEFKSVNDGNVMGKRLEWFENLKNGLICQCDIFSGDY